MNEPDTKQLIQKRLQSLQKIRHKVLSLPSDEALSLILDAKNPAELVHSFPEEDFYLLVHDIGPDDALPILSLASDKQLEYLLDMDIWDQDRFSSHALTQWLGPMLSADPQRTSQWLATRQTDLLELFILQNLQVVVRDPDQDPSDFGKEFMTLDDVFYFRVHELQDVLAAADDAADKSQIEAYVKDRGRLLTAFMKRLSDVDHQLFQNILLESTAILPAETEEELYRLRNVRLAEKGFLPFDEAVGVYQPLKPQDIDAVGHKPKRKSRDVELSLPTPLFADRLMKPDSVFARALVAETEADNVMELQGEFASLCNQLIVADRKAVKERQALEEVVKKACGYISIGLQHLPGRHLDLLRKVSLADLFRVGFGRALVLKWRAEKWRRDSWFASQELPLSFWGEAWLGVIGGLLLKKPLFFDNYETGALYRDFSTRDDILKTDAALREVMAFDNLLAHLTFTLKPVRSHSLLSYKNLVLTQWARHVAGRAQENGVMAAIVLEDFRIFFNELWTPGKKPRSIKLNMKNDFLQWLSQVSGLKGETITDACGITLENLFQEIESEYGSVDDRSLDPRFMPHFLIEK